jgi:uncharacterized cupredoxin-like copper-binding protein
MKSKLFTPKNCIVLLALTLSSVVFAAGEHAAGHGHSHSDSAAQSAIGKPGVKAKASRTVTVEMSDNMRFTPSEIQVKQGETVRFMVKNIGQVKHELSLGTQKELLEHLEQMKKFPEMEHDEPSKVTLAPGKQGEIVWQFTTAGVLNFACLMPGHYEAGMQGAVMVKKN